MFEVDDKKNIYVVEDNYAEPLDLAGAIKVEIHLNDKSTIRLIEVRPSGKAPYLLSTVDLPKEVLDSIAQYTALEVVIL